VKAFGFWMKTDDWILELAMSTFTLSYQEYIVLLFLNGTK